MAYDYDLIVLGGGSAGMALAGQASKLGAKVAVIEHRLLGGTCVNQGCVPKKIMWYASQTSDLIHNAHALGFEKLTPQLDWSKLIEKRQNYISKARQSYEKKLKNLSIDFIQDHAEFMSSETLQVGSKTLKAPHIAIATGGTPRTGHVPGADLGLTSDGFFELKQCPKNVAIIGGGYIGLEFAGVLQSLGANTHLCIRKDQVLRNFDPMLSDFATQSVHHLGVHLHAEFDVARLEKQPNGQISLTSTNDEVVRDMDTVIWAIGRQPCTQNLNLSHMQIACDENGLIKTDEHHNTSIPGVYALGDITTAPHLTPVAIRAGKRLANRLFDGEEHLALDQDCVPSVVFAHPPLASVGLSETKAIERFGRHNLNIYLNEFTPMLASFDEHPSRFKIKLITQGPEETLVGCHMAGPGCDEMLQGFAVAIQMKAKKKDLDNTIAIHPTSSEEVVLLSETHLITD